MPKQIKTLNFNDTFLTLDHLKDSFPQYQIEVSGKIIFTTFAYTMLQYMLLVQCTYVIHVCTQLYSDCPFLFSALLVILKNKYRHSG